jgi:hypothetical protein
MKSPQLLTNVKINVMQMTMIYDKVITMDKSQQTA